MRLPILATSGTFLLALVLIFFFGVSVSGSGGALVVVIAPAKLLLAHPEHEVGSAARSSDAAGQHQSVHGLSAAGCGDLNLCSNALQHQIDIECMLLVRSESKPLRFRGTETWRMSLHQILSGPEPTDSVET